MGKAFFTVVTQELCKVEEFQIPGKEATASSKEHTCLNQSALS
jgi:hypothetical protein